MDIHDWVTLPETEEELSLFCLEYANKRLDVMISEKYCQANPGNHPGFQRFSKMLKAGEQLRDWHIREAPTSIRRHIHKGSKYVTLGQVTLYVIQGRDRVRQCSKM